jgi:hypothetical protein
MRGGKQREDMTGAQGGGVFTYYKVVSIDLR